LSNPVGQTSTSRGALVLVCPTGLDKRPTIGLLVLVVVHASRAPTVHRLLGVVRMDTGGA
jgi:hypothetical protein